MSKKCNRCLGLESRINGLLKDMREANGMIERLEADLKLKADDAQYWFREFKRLQKISLDFVEAASSSIPKEGGA